MVDSRIDRQLNFGRHRRLPIILQSETAECGLACIAMISSFYGFKTDLIAMRRRFYLSNRGMTLKDLNDVATKMRFTCRPVSISLEQLKQLEKPAVLHWSMNHFIVLHKVKRGAYYIHDPATGARKLSFTEVDRCFTGAALELIPEHDFPTGDETRTLTLWDFWYSARGLFSSLAQVFIASILLQLFAVASPLFMQTVIDNVIVNDNRSLLIVLAIGFSFLLLINMATTAFRELVIISISNRLNVQMVSSLFRHLVRLPMSYFLSRHIGDIVSRFGSLNIVREQMTTGIVSAILDGLLTIVMLIVMFAYDVRLTFIVVFSVALYGVIRALVYGSFKQLTAESIVARARLDSHFMESVRAMETIKVFQQEDRRQSSWQDFLVTNVNMAIRLAQWGVGYNLIRMAIFGFANILVVYFAALAVMDGAMSIGMVFAYMTYNGRFTVSVQALASNVFAIRMADIHLARLADVVFTPRDNREKADGITESPRELDGRIKAVDLAFRYGDAEKPVFRNQTFEILAGETVAIVGPSGSGKTTLMKCLMGLLQPSEGELFLDGEPLSALQDFSGQVGVVLHNSPLFSGTIAENIACFEKQDMSRVMDAARQAEIHDDIQKMQMRYRTLIGDMGSSLSGGQYQRIAIARAIYRNPKILFLDEATSNLDLKTERNIIENIKKLPATRIIISHRPMVVDAADRIIRLAN